MDVNVDIFDEDEQLVAIAHQLAIIVSSDRNKPKVVETGLQGKSKL